ncbi:MAG: ABC transporter permease subunit [Pirellulales bacterium]
MMPYLAIIRDSFHEALVSRVLWILLVITTLVLLAIVPLGFIEQAGSYLSDEDFLDREKLVQRIVAQGQSSQPSPGRRIWELMDEPTKRALAQQADDRGGRRQRFRSLANALQKMIEQRDFFRAEDWQGVPLPKSARDLQAKGLETLPADELARFNRLTIDAAYPNEIAPIPARQLQLAYFHWQLGLTLPVEPEQLFPAINQLLVVILSIFLGVAGVFVAVMVTASMIPQAFEAGSIDLLLSKPISRGGLFLAKFVGGCAFIAINAAYFIGGLWLILGLRLGLWNERLLLAIPLYLFLFAIYYGVSSLAGVVWRNAIVSVVMAVLFWFVCWTLGTATQLVEQFSLNPRRLATIVPAGEDLFAVNTQGEVFRWDAGETDWQQIFKSRGDPQLNFGFGSRLVGPVYDRSGDRILAFNRGFPGISPLAASTRLLVGKRADDWQREEGVNVPDGAIDLFLAPDGELLTATSQAIYRLEGNLEARQKDINVFGLHIPLPEQGGRFRSVGPDVKMRPLQSAAIDPLSGALALFDGHVLKVFHREANGAYRLAAERPFQIKLNGVLAIDGKQVVLALPGEVRRYDRQLKPVDVLQPALTADPMAASFSPDGGVLAVRYRDGTLWLYDVRQDRPLSLRLTGQGDISAVTFAGSTMYVADRLTRVTQYDLATLSAGQQRHGALPLAEKIYRYALHPLYTVFPKPSELNQTVMYLLTSDSAVPGGIRLEDDGPRQDNLQRLDVWGPIWSNLAFLAVVLAAACLYVYRKDF